VREYQNIKITKRERKNPKRLPVRSPKINKKSTGVIANAHNECMLVQQILKSLLIKINKVPRV
jgi:hypothetical protein